MSSRVEEGEKKVRRQRKYETTGGDRESIKRTCERGWKLMGINMRRKCERESKNKEGWCRHMWVQEL